MEKALYKWFLKTRERNFPVTGLMIQEKAKLLHSQYKESPSVNASSGWMQKYKKRFGIRFLTISGEKLSSEPELVGPFKRTLRLKINQLQLTKEQIYNADETGLYWKLLPGKTYVAREEKTAPGRKTEKQRVTFRACTNAVTEFLQSQNLPVKAMLLLDNAASHPPAEQLRSDDGSIFTVYMPPNVTPLIQPMDQNAIRLTKLFYRKNLLSQIIGTNQDIGDALKHISLKDAILNLALAWRNLRPKVIEKCWHNLLSPLADEVDDEEDNIPLSVLRSRIRNEDIDTVRSEIITLLQTSIIQKYSILPYSTY
ncbi:jerky protein homolog-like [Anthonomus grandis grandis]|uniref:jerky protein homolog-like n=1 Tax=Anthonomus grandis grandis TaxID=2921223 RepID=UPI0021665385|nr:jerky protein homolog-like [Anthonomus grandis grandis]